MSLRKCYCKRYKTSHFSGLPCIKGFVYGSNFFSSTT